MANVCTMKWLNRNWPSVYSDHALGPTPYGFKLHMVHPGNVSQACWHVWKLDDQFKVYDDGGVFHLLKEGSGQITIKLGLHETSVKSGFVWGCVKLPLKGELPWVKYELK